MSDLKPGDIVADGLGEFWIIGGREAPQTVFDSDGKPTGTKFHANQVFWKRPEVVGDKVIPSRLVRDKLDMWLELEGGRVVVYEGAALASLLKEQEARERSELQDRIDALSDGAECHGAFV